MKQSGKQPSTRVRRERSVNAGPPRELQERYIPPTDLFFVHSHGSVPEIDPETYRLSVTGLVKKPLVLSLEDIHEEFPRVSITAAIQCAGNRRLEMIDAGKIEGEVPWDTEAASTAIWTGIRLRHVLLWAGLEPEASHVAFRGMDEAATANEPINFGGSIPREKAMSPDVLLAYEVNGEPLTPAQGYPVRVVVPGTVGARSVKWVSEIAIRAEPSDSHFQRNACRL